MPWILVACPLEKKREHTDGEALNCLILGSAASTVGAADGLGVSAAMLVAAVVSENVSCASRKENYLLLRVMMANDPEKTKRVDWNEFKSQPVGLLYVKALRMIIRAADCASFAEHLSLRHLLPSLLFEYSSPPLAPLQDASKREYVR